jgi:hypothetical protein
VRLPEQRQGGALSTLGGNHLGQPGADLILDS